MSCLLLHLLRSHCLGGQHLLLLQPTCYCGGGEEEEGNHRPAATPGCKAGPTGGCGGGCGCVLAPEAHIPVGKVGPGWLAARPHNAPPPVSACCPHPPPGQKEPPQPPLIILQLLQHQGSSWHPPPAAQGLLLLLLLLLQLLQLWHPPPHCTRPTAVVGELAVTVRTYATHVVPFCTNGISRTLHFVYFCSHSEINEILPTQIIRNPLRAKYS